MRATVSSPQATHTADSPYAIASAFVHAFTLAVIPLRLRGSRSTVPSDLLIQTEPPPSTTPVGDDGTFPAARLASVIRFSDAVTRAVSVETPATRLAMLAT